MITEYNAITTDKERLKFFDCDYLTRIKISSILKITAEISGFDYKNKGLSHETLWNQGYVFLLSRISIHIHRYPTDQEILTSSTWESGKKGAMFLRQYHIKDENGKTCIDGISGWILVNPSSRHIYKPADFPYKFPQITDLEMSALPVGKIASTEPIFICNREIKISDIDANGHVYNAIYSDIAGDCLSTDEFSNTVANFRINFICEAKLGDVISLYKEITEGKTVIVGKLGENNCFEAEFLFRN